MKAKAEPMPTGLKTLREVKDDAARWIARRDSGITAAEEAEYDAWLNSDPRHEAAIKRCDAAWAALDRPANRGTVNYVLLDLAALERRQRRRRLAATAAACLLLLGGASIWRLKLPQPPTSTPTTNAIVVLPARQTLPDGSIVELRDGAEIAPDFTSVVRKVVLLRGEAHFQVRKDAQRPFVVEANGVQIRAVGTAFSVQLDSAQVEVLVTEGRVAVSSDRTIPAGPGSVAPAISAPTFVNAGHSLVVPAAAPAQTLQATAVPAPLVSQRLSWRAPRLEFTGTPLAEVVTLLNQHADPANGVRFLIEDPSIAQEQISGLFRADRAEAFIGLLESGFSITAEHRGDREVILRRAR